jgi:carboxylesterase
VTVLPGAEAWSAEGGRAGVLVLHGFTGCPQSMRGLAEACAAAGYAVELPRLPGHGTSVDDMETARWADWYAAAESTYESLRQRCDAVVVAGLSMGGTLATALAAKHPEVAGLVAFNAAIEPIAAMREQVEQSLAAGVTRWPAIGNDVADPDQKELAYDEVPVAAMGSLVDAVDELQPLLPEIRCPVLVLWSPQDHVVTNSSSRLLVERVSGRTKLVTLERSFHVATLDYDRQQIFDETVAFVAAVTTRGHSVDA